MLHLKNLIKKNLKSMYEKKINLNGFNSHIHVVLVLIIKLREISLQDIVKTVWPDIHVGISAKCLLPSL